MFLFSVRDQAWKPDSVCGTLRLHIAAKWCLLSPSQCSSWCCPTFCLLLLAADTHWADDLRRLSTVTSGSPSWAVTAGSRVSIRELWFGLLYALPYVYPHWSSYANAVPFIQFCEIPQDYFAIGIAFSCPKEVVSIRRPGDFVHTPFCRSWIKMFNKPSLSTHPLLPPLHPESPSVCFPPLNRLSVKKRTFPPNSLLFLSW